MRRGTVWTLETDQKLTGTDSYQAAMRKRKNAGGSVTVYFAPKAQCTAAARGR
jgi:hypothetical protein